MPNRNKYCGVSVCVNNDSQFLMPQVYTNNTWKLLKGSVYNGTSWQPIGAALTQMLWFYDSSGKVFYAGNVPFLVRDEYNWVTLLDSNNKNIVDSNNCEVMTY